MLSEETDNPGDSVPPLIEGLTELSPYVQNIGCPAKGLDRVQMSASKPLSFAPKPSQEAPA